MSNKLYILCGAPGSGKSTLAAKLIAEGKADIRHEADDYFIRDGRYIFDASQLYQAHKQCQERVRDDLAAGKNVVVSNTNVRERDRQIYVNIAGSVGAEYEIVVCRGTYTNVHGVPPEIVNRMQQTLEQSLKA